MMTLSYFIPLQKVDAQKREVWGVAAIEQPDRANEIMDYEKSKPNFLSWSEGLRKTSGGKSMGNVRAMHKGALAAVGKVIHLEADDLSKAIRVGVKVVDSETWEKVQEGVYTGFSVGGSYGKKWPDEMNKGYIRYEALPSEISLVDVPCIPGAQFEMIKMDGTSEMLNLGKVGRHSYPWSQCMRDQTKRYGSEETARKVCGMIRNKYGKSLPSGQMQKADGGEPEEPDIEYEGDLEMILQDIEKEMSIQPEASLKLSLAIDLQKGEKTMGKLTALLESLRNSDDEKSRGLADQLEAAMSDDEVPAESESAAEGEAEGQSEEQSGESTPEPESEQETETPPEAPAAGESQGLTADDVKGVVLSILEQLGLVTSEGQNMAAKAQMVEDMRKSWDTSAPELAKIAEHGARLTALTEDLAKIALSIDTLEKRSQSAPVVRDLGVITPQMASDMQRADLLRKMRDESNDPSVISALNNEISVLEVKAAQQKRIPM